MYAVVDTGTTNTRIYIIDHNQNIAGRAYKKDGVRDIAVKGTKRELKDAIMSCFKTALENANASVDDIQFFVLLGMITSEIGLIELKHLTAPVGIDELTENLEIFCDAEVLPVNVPCVFIRGVKNNTGPINHYSMIRYADFMRGEETQVMGVLEKLSPNLPCNVIFFTSHTKIVHVDAQGRIAGCITTLSGQIYDAVINSTFIGKSVDGADDVEYERFYSEEILKAAKECIDHVGFLRTLMMPRYMDVLLGNSVLQRKFFLEAAIACDDIKILNALDEYRYSKGEFVFVGHKKRCEIYQNLFRLTGIKEKISMVYDNEWIECLTVMGAGKIVDYAVKRKILPYVR